MGKLAWKHGSMEDAWTHGWMHGWSERDDVKHDDEESMSTRDVLEKNITHTDAKQKKPFPFTFFLQKEPSFVASGIGDY